MQRLWKAIDAFALQNSTYDSIYIILNTRDEDERNRLTEQWRNHKLEELNFIGIVVRLAPELVHELRAVLPAQATLDSAGTRTDAWKGALLAGCLTSTGDWPTVLSNGREQPWTVTTCWYSGIVCALFSVLSVAQQSMHLHRLSAHRDGLKRIRSCMSRKHPNPKGRSEPQKLRIYSWQVGPALLLASVLFMVLGMTIMLWEGTRIGPLTLHDENGGWWQSTSKVGLVEM